MGERKPQNATPNPCSERSLPYVASPLLFRLPLVLSCCLPPPFSALSLPLHQVFSSYECRTITDRGLPHPGDVAEAASLA